jgi:carbon storage regulator
MLYLTRKLGQAVIIDNVIEVRVVELRGRTVKLGFSFPPEVSVLREEVVLQVRAETLDAARAAAELDAPVPESTPVPVAPRRRGRGGASS